MKWFRPICSMTAFPRQHSRMETSGVTDSFTEREEKYAHRRVIVEREESELGKTDSRLDFCSSKSLCKTSFRSIHSQKA